MFKFDVYRAERPYLGVLEAEARGRAGRHAARHVAVQERARERDLTKRAVNERAAARQTRDGTFFFQFAWRLKSRNAKMTPPPEAARCSPVPGMSSEATT